MFFDSFSSRTLQAGMDATWMKMQVHLDNIANYETPNYKAKKVSFQQTMQRVQGTNERIPMMQTKVYTDENTEIRVDGSNVSMENEQLELWRAQAQYAYAVQKINEEHTNLRTIISQVGK